MGLQVRALVRTVGLVTFTNTSGTVTAVLRQAYENWLTSPDFDARKLSVYRIESTRAYKSKRNPAVGILHAPIYLPMGSIERTPSVFGQPLREWPKVPQSGPILLPPAPTDVLFDGVAVEIAEGAPETKPSQGRKKGRKPTVPPHSASSSDRSSGPDPDLEDEIPF
jgi:hypothetical protein